MGPVKEPGTLTQGAPVFPGSSRLGIEPKVVVVVQNVQFTPFYPLLFITVGPISKLFAWGRGRVEDTCYEIQRAEALCGLV
jgi:hypothetical protein